MKETWGRIYNGFLFSRKKVKESERKVKRNTKETWGRKHIGFLFSRMKWSWENRNPMWFLISVFSAWFFHFWLSQNQKCVLCVVCVLCVLCVVCCVLCAVCCVLCVLCVLCVQCLCVLCGKCAKCLCEVCVQNLCNLGDQRVPLCTNGWYLEKSRKGIHTDDT